MIIALAWIVGQWFIDRDPQTHVFAVVVNQGQKQSGQLDNLSIAPLRFTASFSKSLDAIGEASNLHPTKELPLEMDKLEERLISISKLAHKRDTVLCSIQAQCMTIDGEAKLIDANFSLLDGASESHSTVMGGVSLTSLLKLFEVFPGTIVIALDAGDVVADFAAQCDQNDFLLKMQEIVKESKNSRLWILTSHSPGEISQDDLNVRERLFGRAIFEALTGSIRAPKSEEILSLWGRDRLLSLDELANYVYRRVQSDSGRSQSPWLIRGGKGVVQSDKEGWPEARSISLAKINQQGHLSELTQPKIPDTQKISAESGGSTTKEPKPMDLWIQNWHKFEKEWNRKANEASYAWSLAECFPYAYRKMRAQLVDAELRSRAGLNDTSSWSLSSPDGPDPSDLQRIRDLFESDPVQKKWDATELTEKQAQAQFLQQICRASLYVSEIQQLTNRLDTLGEKPRPTLDALVAAFKKRSTDSELRRSLQPILKDLLLTIETLIADSIDNPKMAVLESLLLCGSLTADQRERVLLKKLKTGLPDQEYPTFIPEFPSSWNKPLSLKGRTRNLVQPQNTPGEDTEQISFAFSDLIQQGLRDDRLIARTDQAIFIKSQLALLPSTPNRKAGWWHGWTQNGSSIPQPMRLEPTQRVSLSLKLDPYPRPDEIRIQRGMFPDDLPGLKLDGERIDDANPTFVRSWSQIEKQGQSIEVELESNEPVRPSSETMTLKIAGLNGPTNANLPLRLRFATKDRIEVNAYRLVRKDGKDEWLQEESSIQGRVFRLRPFSGHETRFSFEAINRGETPKTIHADLYPLPTRSGVPGVLVSNDSFLQSDFNEENIVRQVNKSTAIASLKDFVLKPQQATKMVLLPIAPTAAPAATPATPAKPISSPDVSAGMILILSNANGGATLESFLFEYAPTRPSEYVEAHVTVETNEQNRLVSAVAKFQDANQDGLPDLAPTDNQAIDVSIFREPWMGANPKGEFNGVIDPTRKQPLRLRLQIPLDAAVENMSFFALDIGGFPRALTRSISIRDPKPQALESFKGEKPRADVRSISDGTKTYWRVLPIEQKPGADFSFGPKSLAIFAKPKQVEVNIALDWASDIENGQWKPAFLRLGDSEKSIYGDRNWVFQLKKIGEDGFTIDTKSSDHSLPIDSSGMQNQALSLRAVATDRESNPIEVVFDGTSPEIRGLTLSNEVIYKGDDTSVEFEVQEHGLSGISQFEMLVINNLNEEKIKLPGFLKQSESERGSRSIQRSLPVGKLDIGVYKVLISVADLAGNGPVRSNSIPFRIRERPKPSTPEDKTPNQSPATKLVLGSIQGKVRFANGEEPPSSAKVSLDSNGKSDDFSKGDFRFTEVPLGKYKLTAEFPWQSSIWVGQASGEFKTESDFKKVIEIKCKKGP